MRGAADVNKELFFHYIRFDPSFSLYVTVTHIPFYILKATHLGSTPHKF